MDLHMALVTAWTMGLQSWHPVSACAMGTIMAFGGSTDRGHQHGFWCVGHGYQYGPQGQSSPWVSAWLQETAQATESTWPWWQYGLRTSTWLQAQTEDIYMAFDGNMGHGHQLQHLLLQGHGPQWYRKLRLGHGLG